LEKCLRTGNSLAAYPTVRPVRDSSMGKHGQHRWQGAPCIDCHTPYHDLGAKAYDQQVKDREVAHLRKKAAQLGYALTATIP